MAMDSFISTQHECTCFQVTVEDTGLPTDCAGLMYVPGSAQSPVGMLNWQAHGLFLPGCNVLAGRAVDSCGHMRLSSKLTWTT